MVSFGDSKHNTVKPIKSLFYVIALILALSAKCLIHEMCALYKHTAHTHRKLRINSKITNEFMGFQVGVTDPEGASPLRARVTP